VEEEESIRLGGFLTCPKMGACLAVDEAAVRSRALDKENKKDWREDRRVVRLLLLGTGGSGKSTVVKQMRILHGDQGLTPADRQAAISTCRSNCLDSMALLLSSPQMPMLDSGLAGARTRIGKAAEVGAASPGLFSPLLARDIALLWSHPAVEALAEKEVDLGDSAPYFLDSAERLAQPGFLPSDEDILRARSLTTGIVVVPFQTPKLKFELVDVGGQRSERKKWIQCFDNVTAVLFIISLSDFNQMLYEDDTTNRMRESQKLFDEILNSIFFQKTPFIVFFNKVDLFREKLRSHILADYLPDYGGPNDFAPALEYIKRQYLKRNKEPNRDVYDFATTATDTDLVKNIFGVIQDIILSRMLESQGFE